jgi:glycosyltransferase involved in cell wall biosynthesis
MSFLSIIIPSFNSEKFITETLDSVCIKTEHQIELIVIDAASKDNTLSILDKYAKSIDVLISEPDEGQANAIQKGFKIAKGKYVTWINSDDTLNLKNVLSNCEFLEKNEVYSVIYGDIKIIDEYSRDIATWSGRKEVGSTILKPYFSIPQQGTVFRKNVVNHIDIEHLNLHYVFDRFLFIRCLEDYKCYYRSSFLGSFRHHKSSKSIGQIFKWRKDYDRLYDHYILSETKFIRKLNIKFVKNYFSFNYSFKQRNYLIMIYSLINMIISIPHYITIKNIIGRFTNSYLRKL